MPNLWVSSLACTVLLSAAVGQHHVSTIDVAWPNTSGAGSTTLFARVHYPAVANTTTAALQPSLNGYPVVVFLHGFGMLGNDYSRLGDVLGSEGFVAVMLNTARYSYTDMEDDARAIYDGIAVANSQPGGFFEGQLQVDRVGLLGHSMGGAVIAYVLNADPTAPAVSPGYSCGLALAPVNPSIAIAGTMVQVPLGLVSGQGDTLTPPALHAVPYYNSLAPSEGLKFHYQMGQACTHMNMVGLTTNNPKVYERTSHIAVGFFGQFLGDSFVGLDAVLGPDGLNDPNLASLDMDAAVPQTWASSDLTIGMTTRVSVAAENGFAGLLAAHTTSVALPTLWGPLLLDPTSAFSIAESYIVGERLDVFLTVPNTPGLVGVTFAVQGAGATINNGFRFGSAINFVIK